MVLILAVAVVLSQSTVRKVEVIRGGSTKKAQKTETSLTPAPSPTPEPLARVQPLEDKSVELKATDAANAAQKENDAKAQAAQQKILEKHSQDLQQEYEKAANALAGQE
jgi:acyl-CoA reductase-like NAD-dependent aldehyde dehydrogenase